MQGDESGIGIRVGFGFWSRVRQGSGCLSRVIHRVRTRVTSEEKCDLIQVPRPFRFIIVDSNKN